MKRWNWVILQNSSGVAQILPATMKTHMQIRIF